MENELIIERVVIGLMSLSAVLMLFYLFWV
jgi:hypothetical protein